MPSAFYEFQTVHDLRALAERADAAVRGRLMARVPQREGPSALDHAISAGSRLDPAAAPDLYDALRLAATLPRVDRDTFILATALLLADRLQHGGGTDDLWHHWDTLGAEYAALPRVPRSAILRGFRVADARGLIDLEIPPRGPTLLTAPVQDVANDLRALARTATEVTLEPVAPAEPVAIWATSRAMPAHDTAPPDATTYGLPPDAIERDSVAPSAPTFVASTAILLLNDLKDGAIDGGRSAARWADPNIVQAYLYLPHRARLPILAGFRALAERDLWDPYAALPPDQRSPRPIPLPAA